MVSAKNGTMKNFVKLPALANKISKEALLVAMEVAFCCQSVAAIELRIVNFRRGGDESPSLLSHRRVKKHGDEFSHAVVLKNLSLRRGVSGDSIGSSLRVRDGYGASMESRFVEVRAIRSRGKEQSGEGKDEDLKVCLRCGMAYRDEDNSPVACKYHGHMTGDRGLYALAPPHQGIDGEWTDASGVIVYKWNNENDRPSTGSKNWKRRWTCCGVYAEDAVPCHLGSHVSYDDGATRF